MITDIIALAAANPIAAAVLALVGLALLFGALLGFAAERFRVEGDPIVEQIDALLPQTQCGRRTSQSTNLITSPAPRGITTANATVPAAVSPLTFE